MNVFYRVENFVESAGVDEWDNPLGPGRARLRTIKYPMLKRTPCGVWIDVHGSKKFVNLKARKKFACETEADAMASFVARKRRQIAILAAQMRHAQEAIILANERLNDQIASTKFLR